MTNGEKRMTAWVQLAVTMPVIALAVAVVMAIGMAAHSVFVMSRSGDPMPAATPVIRSLAH